MSANRSRRAVIATAAGVSLLALSLAGCSGGGGAAADGTTTISYLIDNGQATALLNNALIAAFEKKNPKIKVKLDTRPPGAEGDNLIKTKLSTGDMNDLFFYNSGSLLLALNPDQNLVNLAGEPWVDKLDDNFKKTVSTANGLYGAPGGQAMGGAIIYNKDIYAQLGLKVPKTWDEFMANNQAIKDAGVAAPVIQTYADTWSSQLLVLGDFANVAAQDSKWADKYTANKVKYSDKPAVEGFAHLQELHDGGFLNKDYASATYDDGVRMVATGKGAHYPILTFAASLLAANYPDAVDKVGTFPIPGSDAAKNNLTVWMPSATYIPKSTQGAKLDAAKKFVAFVTTPEACDVMSKQVAPTGPFVVKGCKLPDTVPAMVSDMQPYFDAHKTGLALEFLSPIKGPALEQITVAVGSGITPAPDGAGQYDEDVKKQAQQLGLKGW